MGIRRGGGGFDSAPLLPLEPTADLEDLCQGADELHAVSAAVKLEAR